MRGRTTPEQPSAALATPCHDPNSTNSRVQGQSALPGARLVRAAAPAEATHEPGGARPGRGVPAVAPLAAPHLLARRQRAPGLAHQLHM